MVPGSDTISLARMCAYFIFYDVPYPIDQKAICKSFTGACFSTMPFFYENNSYFSFQRVHSQHKALLCINCTRFYNHSERIKPVYCNIYVNRE